MTVLRINKREGNFVILDKTCLNQATLSWGAKGLHSYLMGLPPNWKIRIENLQKCASNGRDAVRGFLHELQEAGYIQKEPLRDANTGKYLGIEYVVHEIPQNFDQSNIPDPMLPTVPPETDFQSAVTPLTGKPATGNPTSGLPAPENPTLININNNKYLNNKDLRNKQTAASRDNSTNTQEHAAAVVYLKHSATNEVLISETLTPSQESRIHDLVQQINNKIEVDDPQRLAEEIRYCLLNPKNFTGCGQDFFKKLNAIRRVILRGDWITPADILIKAQKNADDQLSAQECLQKMECSKQKQQQQQLELELREAHASVHHFQRLWKNAKEATKEQLANCVKTAQQKAQQLEEKLRQQTC